MPLVMIKSDPRAREKPCIRCGYSLRKVTDSMHCPECGLSVWLSLNQNDTLEYSNPEWLRRSAVALLVLAASGLLAVAALAAPTIEDYRVMQFHHERDRAIRALALEDDDGDSPKWAKVFAIRRPNPNFDLLRIAEILGAAALAGQLAGLWLLTAPEGRHPDRLATHRVLARVVCAAGAIALLLTLLNVARNHPPLTGLARDLSRLAALLAGTVAWAHLRRLALRIPHKALARVATWMTFAPLAALFYAFVRDSDWLPDPITPLYLLASAGLGVAFALRLEREARLADRHWSTETAQS